MSNDSPEWLTWSFLTEHQCIIGLSNDSLAILLLCTHLVLPPKPDPAPLALKNLNPIAQGLSQAGMRPGDLQGKSPGEITGMTRVKDQ